MNTTKLQIPMKKSLRERADIVAERKGYSSLQEYVRVLLTEITEKESKAAFHTDNPIITKTAMKRIMKEGKQAGRERKAGKLVSLDDFMIELTDDPKYSYNKKVSKNVEEKGKVEYASV